MASPFPGMDPFIEGWEWEDFHHDLISVVREALVACVRPRYLVRAEKRVYLEHHPEAERERIQPDVTVLQGERQKGDMPAGAVGQEAGRQPVLLTLPMPEEQRETFLSIRIPESLEVVTVIEVLSPANKRPGADGRREYLTKREEVLRWRTHLVELDLLRGGERMPTVQPFPGGDFCVLVCRGNRRPKAEGYAWRLRDRMPTVPIPLAGKDPDVQLDLQKVFETVYDRSGYDYSLPYRAPVRPPLGDADAAWVQQVLLAARRQA